MRLPLGAWNGFRPTSVAVSGSNGTGMVASPGKGAYANQASTWAESIKSYANTRSNNVAPQALISHIEPLKGPPVADNRHRFSVQ